MEFKKGAKINLHEAIENSDRVFIMIKKMIGMTGSGDDLIVVYDVKTGKYRNTILGLCFPVIKRQGKFINMKTENLRKIMKHNAEAKQEFVYRVKHKLL